MEQGIQDELYQKVKQKKNRKRMIVIVILIAAVLIIAVGIFRGMRHNGTGIVTVSIECTALSEDITKLKKPELKQYIPKDGIILKETEYRFQEGESVYDALSAVCLENDVQLDSSYNAAYHSHYVKGIQYLYEFDGGQQSGWMYSVNGESPNYGASSMKLKDGDRIIWYYTLKYQS